MKIVIDIPEETYKNLLNNYSFSSEEIPIISLAIATGTPLPKGHGRLIDADAATKDIDSFQGAFAMYTDNMGKYNIVCTAPTVIEADKDGDADG